jgi:thymidine phosphorylase
VNSIDALNFGKALVQLGGGRMRKEDDVDPGVGFILNKKVGEKVEKGELLYTVLFNDENKLRNADDYLKNAVDIGEDKKELQSLILDEM